MTMSGTSGVRGGVREGGQERFCGAVAGRRRRRGGEGEGGWAGEKKGVGGR